MKKGMGKKKEQKKSKRQSGTGLPGGLSFTGVLKVNIVA